MATRYGWRPGSRIGIDAQAAGKEMAQVEKREGRLTPDLVLERARSANSALHPHFEWDDAAAADQHRLTQAGELIRSITVDISRSNVEPAQPVRAFVSVERDDERSYVSTTTAMSDVQLRRQVLERAWAELLAVRRKYGDLKELASVFEAMDRVRPAA